MRHPSRTKPKILTILLIGFLLAWGFSKIFVQKPHSSTTQSIVSRSPFRFAPDATVNRTDPTGIANFGSHIPIIVLQAELAGPVSRAKSYDSFKMKVFEPKNGIRASFTNLPSVTERVGLRLHGMVSRSFPKLSYRLKIQDQSGGNKRLPLLGMPADADWILQGPWLDKSLIRNAFSYDLAKAMGCVAMRTRPCELFLNTSGTPVTEADYLGVYQLTEHIERGKERVNVTKLAPDENKEPAITGGYLLAWDVGEGRYLPSWRSIQLKDPKEPSQPQIKWIDRAFTRFDKALKGPDFRDPIKGYSAHIDVDAWINYILFEELVFNLDGYIRSFYMHKERNGKICPGPVWDHDLAMGHEFPDGTRFTDWWYIDRAAPHGWVPRLVSDPAFAKKMAERWAVLRGGVLTDSQIDARIDAFAKPLLSGAADRNFQRWRILNVRCPFKIAEYITFATNTYPEQIAALKQFLHQRAAWMDANL